MLLMNVEIGLPGIFRTFDHNHEAENELFYLGGKVFYIA